MKTLIEKKLFELYASKNPQKITDFEGIARVLIMILTFWYIEASLKAT